MWLRVSNLQSGSCEYISIAGGEDDFDESEGEDIIIFSSREKIIKKKLICVNTYLFTFYKNKHYC